MLANLHVLMANTQKLILPVLYVIKTVQRVQHQLPIATAVESSKDYNSIFIPITFAMQFVLQDTMESLKEPIIYAQLVINPAMDVVSSLQIVLNAIMLHTSSKQDPINALKTVDQAIMVMNSTDNALYVLLGAVTAQ